MASGGAGAQPAGGPRALAGRGRFRGCSGSGTLRGWLSSPEPGRGSPPRTPERSGAPGSGLGLGFPATAAVGA